MTDLVSGMHVRITGRVQGVWYRGWVVKEARARALAGWVRNRADGSVEAVFAGPAEAVAAMIDACRQGPPAARVAAVETSPIGDEALAALGPAFEQRDTE
jgi:acylphosphatase